MKKKSWSKNEKINFKNNIKALALKEDITINTLQEKIGKKNIFRMDTKRPSDKLITLLSKFFNVSEDLLVAFHVPGEQEQQPAKKYTAGGTLIDTSGLSRADMASLRMVINLLEARHPVYTAALKQNITAFHQALQNEPECRLPETDGLKKTSIP